VPLLGRHLDLPLQHLRPEHVRARLAEALRQEGLTAPVELVRAAAVDAAVRRRARATLTVSVSGPFRDLHQFELLETRVVQRLMRLARVQVLSAGAADGSELCSVATVLERSGRRDAFLLGSDLLEENVARARAGHGSDGEPCACRRWGARYEQRDLVRQGPPEGEWDLIVCRNLAIYLTPAARRRLHAGLAGGLGRGGVLLLGRAERLEDPATLGLERIGPNLYGRAS
jgi:chemotaxis protein methyltransferase CheR